jgi:hypothetical protein
MGIPFSQVPEILFALANSEAPCDGSLSSPLTESLVDQLGSMEEL